MGSSDNLIFSTLGLALSGMWSLFWPVLVPLILLALLAFGIYIVRRVMSVG